MKGILIVILCCLTVTVNAGDFVNLTFDNPDLTGSLTPIVSGAPNGPFLGETSRILPGWTVTANGIPVTTVTYSPWPTLASERTVNVWSYRPGDSSQLGGSNRLYVFSGGNPLGSAFRISQTGTIPVGTAGLHIFAPGVRDMRINGEAVSDPRLGFLADPVIDVSRYAGREVSIEFGFGPGFGGTFDIFGFTQVPEPSTSTLFGCGALIMGWMIGRRR